MTNILFRWAPLPGWTRSWPRSREREVGWRGRGPSSLRGRQGREQDDDYYVEDHDDDDVLLIAQHPDWPRSGRLSASPRCKERSRWRRQPARSSSERRLWNLCLTKYDSCHSPLKHANIVGNMVYLKDCGDYHSSHLFLNNVMKVDYVQVWRDQPQFHKEALWVGEQVVEIWYQFDFIVQNVIL